MNIMIAPSQLKGAIPISSHEITERSQEARLVLRKAAEESLKVQNPRFEEEYTGAEREGMISQRAAQIHGWMDVIWDVVGADLIDDLRTTGAYHPDLRSDPQELVDELYSKLSQDRMYQMRFIVHEVFPKAEQLGVNIAVWLTHTTKYKLLELSREFRHVLEEMDGDEQDDLFLQIVALTTRTMTEIREAKMVRGPKQFSIYEEEAGDGYEWLLPAITSDTRDWLLRRVQPYGRLHPPNGQA